MSFVVPVVLLLLGAVLLTVGADGFAEHITAASSRLGVSVLALGLLLAGAEPEEALTAMLASGRSHPALAAGDAIGANLVILTLTLGLAAMFAGLPVSRRVVEYAVAAAVAGALAVLFLWDGVVTRAEGVVLVLAYAAGVAWVWRREKEPPVVGDMSERDDEGEQHEQRPRALLFVLLGLLGMVFGGYLAVRGAEGLVDVFGLTESVVGLTILALATSAEMMALVWSAHRRGVSEVVVAGAVGSVAYNATVSLGLAALVSPLGLGRASPALQVGVVTMLLPLLLVTGRRTGRLPRSLGAVLVAGYLLAVGWLFHG